MQPRHTTSVRSSGSTVKQDGDREKFSHAAVLSNKLEKSKIVAYFLLRVLQRPRHTPCCRQPYQLLEARCTSPFLAGRAGHQVAFPLRPCPVFVFYFSCFLFNFSTGYCSVQNVLLILFSTKCTSLSKVPRSTQSAWSASRHTRSHILGI